MNGTSLLVELAIPISVLALLLSLEVWAQFLRRRRCEDLETVNDSAIDAVVKEVASGNVSRRPNEVTAELVVLLQDNRWRSEARPAGPGLVGGNGEVAKIVLRSPVGRLVEQWEEGRAEQGLAALIGSSFTGIALFFTFLLIALVLFTDVPAAFIKRDAAQTSALADAVAKMGLKFLISCGGIFFALFDSAADRRLRSRIDAEVKRIGRRLGAKTTTVDDLRLDNDLAVLAAVERQGATLGTKLDVMATKLDGLRNIEVSVKDLGAEVTKNLGSLMKDTLAHELKQMLTDVRGVVEDIERRLSESLQGNLRVLGEQLGASLGAIKQAVESQAGSQVERLLENLIERIESVVSGGMKSEAKNLGGLLESFQSTIPALAANIAQMTAQMGAVLSDLRDQHAQAEAQRRATTEAATASLRAANQEIFQESGRAIGKLLADTNGRIAETVKALETSSAHSRNSTTTIRADFEEVAKLVSQVTSALRASLVDVESVLRKSQDSLSSSSNAVQSIRGASATLERAASGVAAVAEKGEASRSKTEEMLALQARMTDDMQRVWPQLLQDVSTALQLSSDALGNSWTKLADRLEKVTSRYGTEVGARVEELSESIDRLIAAQNRESERQDRRSG